jgi:hypothetical protein
MKRIAIATAIGGLALIALAACSSQGSQAPATAGTPTQAPSATQTVPPSNPGLQEPSGGIPSTGRINDDTYMINLGHWKESGYNDEYAMTGRIDINLTPTVESNCNGATLPHGQWAVKVTETLTSENDRGFVAFPEDIGIYPGAIPDPANSVYRAGDLSKSNTRSVGWCDGIGDHFLNPGETVVYEGTVVMDKDMMTKGTLAVFAGLTPSTKSTYPLGSMGVKIPTTN